MGEGKAMCWQGKEQRRGEAAVTRVTLHALVGPEETGDFTLSLTLHPTKSDLNLFFHRPWSYRKGTDVLTSKQQMTFPESCY